MNTYQVRFKPTVANGFNVQFELEAATPEKAVSMAIRELLKSCMSTTHCFESVSQKGSINQ